MKNNALNVCLIYPSTSHMIKTNVPDVVDSVAGVYPPLGLLYVAAAVQEDKRHNVSVIDCVAENLSEEGLSERLKQESPDVVGVQAVTFSVIDVHNTLKLVKSCLPEALTVVGGPHANLYPQETISWDECDYLLLGEGERSITRLLDAIADGGEVEKIPGVVYKSEAGSVVYGPPNNLIEDLDLLPFPARNLIPQDKYVAVLSRSSRVTTIMSSRGCPARCIYCDRPHLGKSFRYRSARSVVDEMEQCFTEYGIEEFVFYDDTFTIKRERVLDICSMIKERNLKVSWDVRARISTVDHDMLRAMKEAGCLRIHFGIESGNREVLKVIRKGVDLDKARQVFRDCRKLGIETLAYFMFGFPGEGKKEAIDTINYALSIPCDFVHAAATTPFPGTELYQMGLDRGLFNADYWSAFASDPDQDFLPEVWDENLTRDEIYDYMLLLYRKFYRRPRYIIRRLLAVRSFSQLCKYAKAGAQILFIRSRSS